MSTVKPRAKSRSRTPPVAPPSRESGVTSFEGVILRALGRSGEDPFSLGNASSRSSKSTGRKKFKSRRPDAPKKKPSLFDEVSRVQQSTLVLDPAHVRALATMSKDLQESLKKSGLLQMERVRFRPSGLDRQFNVAYAPDPDEKGAVLLRISPVSDSVLPESMATDLKALMVSTQKAADMLHVSRPYVVKLVDAGRFQGVSRSDANHRKIPVAEVERVAAEMKATRQAALAELDDVTEDARTNELKAALEVEGGTRWVRRGT